MATNQGYSLVAAMADLMQANLLHSVLLPENGKLKSFEPTAALEHCRNLEIFGAGLDSRNLSKNNLFIALVGDQVDGRDYAADPLAAGHWVLTRPSAENETDPLLKHKSVPGCGVLLCQDPEKALARLAACWRQNLNAEIVAITGTNGKTTTKDLVRVMLAGEGKTQATAGNLNNHLGLPLTLLNLEKSTRFAVIEMGASSVGEIRFLAEITVPKVGVITNASAAHLEEFGSLENIIEGKGELLEFLPLDGVAVLNADSPGFEQWRERAVCPVVSWGSDKGDHRWAWRPATAELSEQMILDGSPWTVPLPGRHNAANLCAAILACRALGIDDGILATALQSFTGSAHRGIVVPWAGRFILDDSYNANPASMLAAVQALSGLSGSGRTIAVLGAMAELGPGSESIHRRCGHVLGREKLDFLVAVGEPAFPMTDNHFESCAAIKVPDHQAAADWLRNNTTAGDRILIKGSRSSAMEKILHLLQQADEILNEGNTS